MELENLVANSLLLKARLGGCPADPRRREGRAPAKPAEHDLAVFRGRTGGTGRALPGPGFTQLLAVGCPPRVPPQAAQVSGLSGQVSAQGRSRGRRCCTAWWEWISAET